MASGSRGLRGPAHGLRRLIRGDPRRRTRLHDFEGNLLPLKSSFDVVPCLATTIARKLGIAPLRPWLPYPVLRFLARRIEPSWSILEYGSGGSTLWLARRATRVVSVESDPLWFERVRGALAERGIVNVDQRLFVEPDRYAAAGDPPAASFDFVLIDGAWRDRCVAQALRLARPEGCIYLDNSDVPDPDHRAAVRELLGAARSARRFVGLAPEQLAVGQGLFVRL